MLERRGTCPECGKNSAVTARGMVRMHLVPGNARTRGNCPGSGWPPAVEGKWDTSCSSLSPAGLSPEVVELARAYNFMHRQLCPRGQFCSEHMTASALLDAVWRRINEPAPPLPRFVDGVRCPCWYPDLDPEDENGVRCECGHAMDEHGDNGYCTITLPEGV